MRSTSGCLASSSRTALRSTPVPRPCTTRTSRRPASAASSTSRRASSRASCAGRPRTSTWSDTSLRAAARTCTTGVAFLGRALARRTQPRERDAHPLPGRADDLGVVAADRGDRPAHTDVRRLDRVAFGERRRRVERLDACVDSTRGRLARPARSRLPGPGPGRHRDGRGAPSRTSPRSARDLRARIRELALDLARPPPVRACSADARTRSSSRSSSASRAVTRREPSPPPPPPLARGPLRRLRLGDELRRPQPLRRDARTGVGDDRRVEPEPLGDAKRVRRAGPAEREPVERRVGLQVEAGGGVRDAVVRARPLLQLGVVRRHDRQPRLRREPLERAPARAPSPPRDRCRRRPRRAARATAPSPTRGSRRACGRGRRRSRGSSRSTGGRRCRRARRRRPAAPPRRPAGAGRTGGAAPRGRASSARPSCRRCSDR